MFSLFLITLNFLFIVITSIFVLLVVILIATKVYSSLTKESCKSKARLDGKVALITGGNSGIGLETAKDLAKRGARVIIASRDVTKSAKAVADIITETGNIDVEQKYLDLAKFTSVRSFAEEFNKSFDRLDILVNNSGTAGMKHKTTEDAIDVVTEINYFGPFLLTNLLLGKIISSKPSRIVIVSSKAHHYAKLDLDNLRCLTPTPWFTIYANTKLLNILWAKALSKQVPEGVTVNALHPGVVKTEIFNRFGLNLRKFVLIFIGAIFKTAEEGAQTSIHLAVSEDVENVTGRYFEDCQLSEESKDARNEDLINEVWEKSVVITNSQFPYSLQG